MTYKEAYEAVKAERDELKEILDNTHRLELDNEFTIFRGAMGYEVQFDGDNGKGIFQSIQSAYRHIERI